MEAKTITITPRASRGKGEARRLRSRNMIPAVVYGPAIEPMPVAVSYKDIESVMERNMGPQYFRIVMKNVDGRTWEGLSLIKDMARNPIDGKVIHLDFYVVEPSRKVTVNVPIKLVGEPQGVRTGGELQEFKRSVRISCLPDVLPQAIIVDITALKVGESLRVSDLPLPPGVSVQERGDQTIVYIAPTRVTVKSSEKGGT